ncbi:hypothetical protein ACFLTH_04420 [Bacteroidota bacterium]
MTATTKFIWKIALFLFGLSNVIPSKISLYDKVVTLVVSNTKPETVFYTSILILAVLFRIGVAYLTYIQLKETIDYGNRYVFTKRNGF